MNKKQLSLFISCLCVATLSMAQGNLVENDSFEELDKKVKDGGMIELAEGWSSPTDAKADVFSENAKSDEFAVPKNKYGDADPMKGANYAGIMIYSYKGESPRQYLQAKFKYRMEAEKVYCVKMHVMLSMLSKYSANNIGIYISKKPLTPEEIESGELEPQVIHSKNKIFDEQFDWTPICQTYIAEGGEQYITIGNFAKEDETLNEKMKKPKGITGMQARGAYYYIDEVSVENMAGVAECDCELDAAGKALNVVYSVETSSEMEMDVSEEIERTRIYFDDGSDLVSELAMADIEKIAEMLKEHPKYKVKITGHTDPVEEAKITGDVSLGRANAVKDALVELGVPENKLLVVGVQDFEPITSDVTSAGQAQNRRVMFKVISKN